jgi:hypothetical protein
VDSKDSHIKLPTKFCEPLQDKFGSSDSGSPSAKFQLTLSTGPTPAGIEETNSIPDALVCPLTGVSGAAAPPQAVNKSIPTEPVARTNFFI